MRLAAGIHVANFGDRVVVLDIRANRYRMVGGRHAELLGCIACGCASVDAGTDPPQALVEAGLVDPSDAVSARVTQAEPASTSAFEEAPLEDRTLTLGRVALASTEAVLRLRYLPFATVLAWATRLKTATRCRSREEAAALIAAAQHYDRLRSAIPLKRICLRDSLALYALLARSGHACDLVFGVRLDPFEAHCWVQAGPILLSDRIDHVGQLRPILTL